MSVLVLAESNVKPEYVNEFKAFIKEDFTHTRAAKGCLGVQLHINQDEPTNMIIVAEWETREDRQKIADWRVETGRAARIAEMCSGPVSVRYFDKTDA